MSKARCQSCRTHLGFSDLKRQYQFCAGLGLTPAVIAGLLPRCRGCLRKTLARHPQTPSDHIRACTEPVYAYQVKEEGWPQAHTELARAKVPWVCVRLNEHHLLVATTQCIEGIRPADREAVARMVERALLARPAEMKARCLATRSWGGAES